MGSDWLAGEYIVDPVPPAKPGRVYPESSHRESRIGIGNGVKREYKDVQWFKERISAMRGTGKMIERDSRIGRPYRG